MRLQQRRATTDRWVVRNDGGDVYRGPSAGQALACVAADPMVVVSLNGRVVYPPSEQLPYGPA